METSPQVVVTKVLRALRGPSKSHLVEANDGHHYVVKTLRTAEQVEVAVGEWLVAEILRAFGVATPIISSIALSLTSQCPDMLITSAHEWGHFASRVPVDPSASAIFDFIPRKLLPTISNPEDFWKVAVIDALVQKTDMRQTVFIRDGELRSLRAWFIDHKCKLFTTPSICRRDFRRTLAFRLAQACPTVAINNSAVNEFCMTLRSSCWMTFLERSKPIPEAWRAHVTDATVYRSLSDLWARFHHVRVEDFPCGSRQVQSSVGEMPLYV